MRVKELNENVVPRVSDLTRRQQEQDRIAAMPWTFEERVLKRAPQPHQTSVHLFPQKWTKNNDVLLPKPVEYKPYEPKHYQAYDYSQQRVSTLDNDNARKDQTASVLSCVKRYDDNFSPQRSQHPSKAMIHSNCANMPNRAAPPIYGFKNLGSQSPEPLPNNRIKKQPFDKVVPPWLSENSESASNARSVHKPNPSDCSTAVGSCFAYTDGYTVPDMVPMPKCAIDIQRQGGNLIENPGTERHVTRHRKNVPSHPGHVLASAPSPPGAAMLSRRDTTMQSYFVHPANATPPPQRRAYTSMLP